MANFSILRGKDTLLVLGTAQGERASIVYCGPDLPNTSPEELALIQTSQHIAGGPQQPIRASLLNPLGTGWPGAAGLIAHRDGRDWAIDLRVTHSEFSSDQLIVISEDSQACIRAAHYISCCGHTGVVDCRTRLHNIGETPVSLEWCAALCIPLDDRLTRLRTFSGKWADEFQTNDIDLARGNYLRENKAGRTSHDNFPGIFLGSPETSERDGLAAAFHLAWSGNSRVRIDTQQDGSTILQMGELLFPGEIQIEPGGNYFTPPIVGCWTRRGFGDLSLRLHDYVHGSIVLGVTSDEARPVHYNTWEAVYFDHSEKRLIDLAEKAAEVGAERFVLDDGWFGSRRSDKAGLGDWRVSPDIYPDGLHPVVKRVRELGMEFGLWFEPEMVNPDSDLYRAHPDWVLGVEGVEPIPSRHQLTLDLTKPEVTDYLFAKISALITEYQIHYIKWDMNRDTQHPGSEGRAVMHQQTEALYSLIERFKRAHPTTEIESCSSGGGRADYRILRYTDRIWTSDNNDARRRHQIMRGASHFFPLSVLGNHVGPKICHITGRQFSMHFRAASAIFGHMGMELDLADETAEDRAILAAAIALHKQHRGLIHEGAYYRLETPDFLAAQSCVAGDSSEALTSYALLDLHPSTRPPRLRFAGLDPAVRYRTRLVWPRLNPSRSSPSIIEAADLTGAGFIANGSALMEHGMQLPLTHPDTCLIFYSEAVSD